MKSSENHVYDYHLNLIPLMQADAQVFFPKVEGVFWYVCHQVAVVSVSLQGLKELCHSASYWCFKEMYMAEHDL